MRIARNTLAVVAISTTLLVTTAWSSPVKPLTINELAAKPNNHIGKVTVVGRVAAATPGKGFTLIDSANCATCTTECLTDKTTKKIPFIWGGTAPEVKAVVSVQGTLAKSSKGYTFIAEKVSKQ